MFAAKAFAALLVTALAVSASPLQARQSCTSTYTVVSGDTCNIIASRTGVSTATIESLNSSINSGCTNLQIGESLCLSTSSTSTSSGSCTSTYTVVSGDTCTIIASKTGVSVATIEADNSAINSGCTNLQVGQVLCLSGTSSTGSSGSTGTGSSGAIDGIATYYDPNGGFGACGSILQNTDYIVALGPNDWNAGAHCGQTVTVQYNGKSVSVVVQDLCPGCQGDHGIDLTEPAMNTIDTNYVFDGHINVVWNFD
ncbi:hypothetical protein MSAN_02492700 [Mycena sanguinolenta]|uniref:LysM domain-containing protein n=1 Tax=Mycena sanguinolenta TaxID=230812 RepID=A0A8H6U1M8_9AGAR|nr:hypothetical protein MSAN_02492700 [Mycena sanguinolenta]